MLAYDGSACSVIGHRASAPWPSTITCYGSDMGELRVTANAAGEAVRWYMVESLLAVRYAERRPITNYI